MVAHMHNMLADKKGVATLAFFFFFQQKIRKKYL